MDARQPAVPNEAQIQFITNAAPVLIWSTGADRALNFINQGWLDFTGRTIDQEYGNGWLENIHPDDLEIYLESYHSSANARIPFKISFRLRHQNGQYYWVLTNAVPNFAPNGAFTGYIGTCTDIDELMDTQRIRNELNSAEALKKEQHLNEELAVTNEEMAATNEELRSANEELITTQNDLSVLNNELEHIVDTRTFELAQSEARFRFLIEGAPVAIATLKSKELVIESANEMILKLWGKDQSIIGQQLADALPELEGQVFLDILTEVYTSGKSFYGNEVKAVLNYGGVARELYFNFIYKPLRNANGETDAIMVVANEVTEQYNSRKKVEAINQRMHSMVMTAPIGMTILRSRKLVIEIANGEMLARWNKTADEVIEKELLTIFPELLKTQFPNMLDGVFNTGVPVKVPEVRSPHLHKEEYIDLSYDPIYDASGNVESILVTVIDITATVMARKLIEKNEQRTQSLNEELTAINEELNSANDDLLIANDNLSIMQAALKEKMELIQANEQQFRFMLNAIPHQVWTALPNGELDYVNDVVCKDFGFTTSEIVGHGWKEFIHPDDLENCFEKWSASLATGNEYMIEFRLRFADGNYQWHLGRALPLIADGKIKLWLGTNTNIDVQKRNDDKKDEFISIASHELKTPLTSIKAFTQLMSRSNTDERMGVFLGKSNDQIIRLEKLIGELLDVTKISQGKMSYNMEDFDFRKMVRTSMESVQHIAPSHELILTDGPEITYHGDPFRIEQVMHNFLTNAVKYSPGGKKVLIGCAIEEGNIIVSIQDFGVGIAKENLNKLFDRYYRVDNTAMRFDGLGLGLYISSEILKRHQGSFWIESELGSGSTFYFGLPIVQERMPTAIVETFDRYCDNKIEIIYNAEKQLLEVDWKGFQNMETVKNGGRLMLEMVKRHHCYKVLNDNTHVLGTWSEAADWAGQEWFPMMQEAGVTHFAWVYSLSGFSQLSAKKSVDVMLGEVTVQFFTEIELAKNWIFKLAKS
jgi:PAS domain S-box-containing protein